jgi:hypothetical protein
MQRHFRRLFRYRHELKELVRIQDPGSNIMYFTIPLGADIGI